MSDRRPAKTKRKIAAALLLVGLSPYVVDGCQRLFPDSGPLRTLGGLAAAVHVAPTYGGRLSVPEGEAQSAAVHIEGTRIDGGFFSYELTGGYLARLGGPYGRRHVFGTALAHGPRLSVDPVWASAWKAVMRWALCGDAPVLAELGIDPSELSGPVHLRYEPRAGTSLGDLPSILGAPCP